MQVITTRFYGPTNTRGSRIRASCAAKTIIRDCDDRLTPDQNHDEVARQLIADLEWFHDEARGDRYGRWFGGTLPNRDHVYICCVEYAELLPEVTR